MKTINRILYKCIWGVSLTLLVNSCSLNEYNPTAVSEGTELNNFDGWKSYQSNCYTGLWGSLIGMQYGLTSEIGTDLWTFPYGNHNQYKNLIAYEELTTGYGLIRNVWTLAWGSIKDCNKTIELASELIDGDETDIKILTGEARFLRAYYYSVIVSHFGGVPLVLIDDPLKNLTPKRNSIQEIYSQIVSDLRFAFTNLPVTPYEGNPARITKKAALGILARVYAQGAGEGLSEGNKSYWVRAKEVADSLINYQSSYNIAMYDDFKQVFAAKNNRNNIEVLFTAYGLDPYSPSYDYFTGSGKPNLYLHYYPKLDDAFGTADVFKRGVNANTSNAYYGRCNQQYLAPTKYLIDCFDARYDMRWENTFVTAYTNYSGVQAITNLGSGVPSPANVTYANATITLTEAMCAKYGIDVSHVGKKIYPYVDVNTRNASQNATWQYIPKVWKKGEYAGSIDNLEETLNANVHPYPLTVDENRFFVYLSKESLSDSDKKSRGYITINIEDMFDLTKDATGSTYKSVVSTNGFASPSLANLFPAMMKFNHNFDGAWLGANFQQKLGNIMVMRMAEAYLIAAEATLNINNGDGVAAANYLNILRKRACRNIADFSTSTGMQLTTATMDDVFDEYARELCGEFNRWTILKRNKAFENRLQRFNKIASESFVPNKHYLRPIPLEFLNQINNAEEFGTNGY